MSGDVSRQILADAAGVVVCSVAGALLTRVAYRRVAKHRLSYGSAYLITLTLYAVDIAALNAFSAAAFAPPAVASGLVIAVPIAIAVVALLLARRLRLSLAVTCRALLVQQGLSLGAGIVLGLVALLACVVFGALVLSGF